MKLHSRTQKHTYKQVLPYRSAVHEWKKTAEPF